MANDWDQRVRWEESHPLCPKRIETARGGISVRRGRFAGGVSEGVEVVELDSGVTKVVVLPTRGMGIWQLESAGTRFGWNSPIEGPVHPGFVPTWEPSGLGWLEGFDELLVRCGIESNGAPEFDEQNHLVYPLHGRIANLPAKRLQIEVDKEAGRVSLIGEVLESRLFFKKLRLRSRITLTAGQAEVEIEDTITNELARPAEAQLLYHINIGPPVLGEGAEVVGHFQEVTPKDELSAGEVESWEKMGPPEAGYAERVYFTKPVIDPEGQSAAMLRSADQALGLGIVYDSRTLPHFIVWKNTAAKSDGYVVGLEPATNLPNTRSEEAAAGRVIRLAAKETARFALQLHPLTTRDQVQGFEGRG